MPYRSRATAFAPGSIGNLGVGLDVLGCAVEGAGDAVTAEWGEQPGVSIAEPGHPDLDPDPERHACGIAATAVVRRATSLGTTVPSGGIVLRVRKGLPLASGQGGSAASAVAASVAVNALLGEPLGRLDLLGPALAAESRVAGRHLDNVAPSLLGGIVLVRSLDPIEVVPLRVPHRLTLVLAHPAQRLRTAEARAVLPHDVPLPLALRQAANIASVVAACFRDDLALLGRAIDDGIAEPARSPLLPGFSGAKAAALAAGALAVSISGAGPTSFAICDGPDLAPGIAAAMCDGYEAAGLACVARVCAPDRIGARLEGEAAVAESVR